MIVWGVCSDVIQKGDQSSNRSSSLSNSRVSGSRRGQTGGIAVWSSDDQPREKILRYGCRYLSDSELLAAILGTGSHTGTGSFSAVDLGRMLLMRYESLRSLAASEAQDLTGLPGIGPAKSAQIVAAFELGRRVSELPEHHRAVLRGPSDVVAQFGPSMRDLHREVFKVVMINSAARIIRTFTASEGGLAASIVEPRIVFRRAILAHAASIICLHNHPSGNLEPSVEDLQITRQLGKAGDVLGIPVRDHIIIAGDGYTSLAERGVLEASKPLDSD